MAPPAPLKKTTKTPIKKSKPERPITPPSSRVTKTQYFPKKTLKQDETAPVKNASSKVSKIYQNDASKRLKIKPQISRTSSKENQEVRIKKTKTPNREMKGNEDSSISERSATFTKSGTTSIKTNKNQDKPGKSGIFKIHNQEISEASSIIERPRTATLRKGSIVNKNIAGPEVPKEPNTASKEEEEEVYEDDFESYESDFEEYDSSDTSSQVSEISTGSTSSESEAENVPKRTNSSDEEKKLDSGNFELPEAKHKQILDEIKEATGENNQKPDSLSDEGFEEAKSLQFVNFLGAQKKQQRRKSAEMRRKRGEEILSMIKLDLVNFTLLDMKPVPYEEFIRNYGCRNTVQEAVQTGDDDIDEEIQTDTIELRQKWTQFPAVLPKFDRTNDVNWATYKNCYLGSGGEDPDINFEPNFDQHRLEKFVSKTVDLILNIQAEENELLNAPNCKSNIPFSQGYILFQTHSSDVIKNRKIRDIDWKNNKILIVHGENTNIERRDGRNIISIWNLSNIAQPETYLCVFGEITCCTFGDSCDTIFSGLDEG